MRMTLFHIAGIVGLAVGLTACAPPPRVEVVERDVLSERAETEKIGGSIIRIVQPGDTLHGIAFGTGLNVNELAAWNRLSDTAFLKVGQQIRLTKPLNYRPAPKQVSSAPKLSGSKPKTNAGGTSTKQPVAAASKPKVPSVQTARDLKWSWPSRGQVIERFSLANGRQGIDILGKRGQPVLATAAGEVVYVGAGLKGYGNLIIIKHSERYLSAYAHNQDIYVKEGQQVLARHTVGAIGFDNKGREAMHFQIRRDGKPVNPLAYLPGRG